MSQSPTNPTKSEAELLAEALAFAYGKEDELESAEAPPPARGAPAKAVTWYPDLNPTQDSIFNDPADNVLGHGEKGSGKTVGFGHKIIRHAYENDNALVLLISPTIRTGNEGIWYDLDNLILPQWKAGIGLEFTNSKLDPLSKDRHRWIKNRFGGWSKLLLMSILHPSQVADRVKGPAPSMVYIDELTNCKGVEYWQYTSAQLGRRRGITGPQQFTASCNPDGPRHWVYKVFFEDAVVNGVRDASFSVHHVPIAENMHRLPKGYVERIEKTFRTDPIALRRLRYGEWVDRPTGEGCFADYFNEALHIKGDLMAGRGLRPIVGFPIIVGYDLGQVHNSITFLQLLPTQSGKSVWIVFDELDFFNQKVLYQKMAKQVVEKMHYWKKLMGYSFEYQHITDESAVNQYRPGTGSYDAWEFEKRYNEAAAQLGTKRMKMQGCPKGPGSVAARIRLLQGKLYQDEIYISAVCQNTRDMLMQLEWDSADPENPKRSRHLHKFDSLTYPMFKLEVSGRKAVGTGKVTLELIRCGSEQSF